MKLPRVKKGQKLLASDFNALAEAIERAHKISVAAPLTMHRGQEGIVIGISLPPGITWFELTEALSPGESAKAKRLRYNADDEDYEVPDGEPEVDVFDASGIVAGSDGDRYPCVWKNGRWEILVSGSIPAIVAGHLTGTLGSTGDAEIDEIVLGTTPDEVEDAITVVNTDGIFTGTDETFLAILQPDGNYRLIWVACAEA